MSEKMILLTRPEDMVETMEEEIQARGWSVYSEPMMKIEALPVRLPDLTGYHGLVFTSANAVTVFETLTKQREIPVYAVGNATAERASQAGFEKVYEGPGTVQLLNKDLAQKTGLKGQSLLHLSGTHVKGRVKISGVDIVRLPVYQAKAVNSLSPACLAHIYQGRFAAVMFFSARTAKIFCDLIGKYERTDSVSSIKALCIADSVVKSLADMPWQDVRVAKTPDRQAMVDFLDDL